MRNLEVICMQYYQIWMIGSRVNESEMTSTDTSVDACWWVHNFEAMSLVALWFLFLFSFLHLCSVVFVVVYVSVDCLSDGSIY